ncbi:MAG: hypothetical protein H6Q33_1111 [Deltaproteobacteria bacterium]|nr:hypothetical protein [Deltaproteobacteria bacterium]
MLPYVHPVSAGVVVVLLGYVGSLGLRARSDPRHAGQYLARHARLAPFMYWLMLAAWTGGLVSTWLLRRDLELATSVHFRCGVASVLALTGGALTSRWMQLPAVRAAHPWFGAAAILLAAAQVFFGLQITP